MKLRHIRSRRKLDSYLLLASRCRVVLRQAAANLVCFHSDDRIFPGIVRGIAAKQLNPQGSFLQFIRASRYGHVHGMVEEQAGAFATAKKFALKHACQLGVDCLST
ncbi:MAG: hypothetical protein ACRD9L_04960, partial [Bryobacteraceae bacterium]